MFIARAVSETNTTTAPPTSTITITTMAPAVTATSREVVYR